MLSKFLLSALALASSVTSSPITEPSALQARSPGTVQQNGDRVVIDPLGVYIRATSLNDGSILAGFTDHRDGQSILSSAHSTDGGASWSPMGTVDGGDSATRDIDNAYVLQLDNGRILYAFRNHDRTSSGTYTYYRITICYSEDGGRTYKFLAQIDERGAAGTNGLWEPFLRVAGDGSVQCYYSSENGPGDQDNLMKWSFDGGATWNGPLVVSGGNTGSSRDGMTGVAPIDNNGNLICVFENTEDGHFTVNYVLSSNDGASWGSRTRLYTPPSGSAGAPQVINVGGTLVASFMTTETTGGSNNVDTGEMRVITSTDGGRTWGGSVVTGPHPSHWPGLYTLDGTHFLALYSYGGQGAVSQVYGLV